MTLHRFDAQLLKGPQGYTDHDGSDAIRIFNEDDIIVFRWSHSVTL
jgi:hypothetical protein